MNMQKNREARQSRRGESRYGGLNRVLLPMMIAIALAGMADRREKTGATEIAAVSAAK